MTTASHLKTYTIRMAICFSVYVILVFAANIIDNKLDLFQWQRIVLAMLPPIPAGLAVFAMVAVVRAMDEVQRRIITESVIISAGVVGIATFTLGFLEGVIDLPDQILIWVWPAMFMVYGVVFPFIVLRYK